MSLIGEMRLVSEGLILHEARRAVPGMVLEVEQEAGTDPDRPLVFFWASGGDFDAFDDALDADPTVTDVVALNEVTDRRLYRVQATEEVRALMYPAYVELGLELLDVRGDADGWDLRIRFPTRDELASFREYCLDLGVSFDLRRLYDDRDGAETEAGLGLTEAQRETIRAALESGYFDVPRNASLGDLAEELDVSRQSASERLRRGMRALARDALRRD